MGGVGTRVSLLCPEHVIAVQETVRGDSDLESTFRLQLRVHLCHSLLHQISGDLFILFNCDAMLQDDSTLGGHALFVGPRRLNLTNQLLIIILYIVLDHQEGIVLDFLAFILTSWIVTHWSLFRPFGIFLSSFSLAPLDWLCFTLWWWVGIVCGQLEVLRCKEVLHGAHMLRLDIVIMHALSLCHLQLHVSTRCLHVRLPRRLHERICLMPLSGVS